MKNKQIIYILKIYLPNIVVKKNYNNYFLHMEKL